MTTYSPDVVLDDIRNLAEEHGLSWSEFLSLGEAGELEDVSEDLDFAYRALLPLLDRST